MQLLKCGIKLCNIAAHNEGVTDLSYIKKLDVLATSGVDSLGYSAFVLSFLLSFAELAYFQYAAGNSGKLKICVH
jgi:hypothetical protein